MRHAEIGIDHRLIALDLDGCSVGDLDTVIEHCHAIRQIHEGHAHFISLGLVADIEGQKVRLSANATVAVTFEEEPSGKPV